ncbi:MAG: hypothetical protein RBU30_14105 [Polyangia bacterium]|jgi:hypothetical protein|nr:hypothetical protein [Polyangia bacterium]
MTKALHPVPPVIAALGILGLTAYHASILGMDQGEARAAGKIPAPSSLPHSLRLHGSTPTLAWSPDGSRLAVASSFEYWGFGNVPKQLTGHTGIYVVDPAARTQWRVSTDQGYHPVWVDKNTLAWGHSPYEDGAPGLYVATLQGMNSSVRRVGTWKGVYHTGLASRGGRVVFFSGFPEDKGWVQADLKTGNLTPLTGATAKGVDSWAPPKGAMTSQCLQQAGTAKTGVTPAGAFLLETRSQNVQIPDQPFLFYNYNGSGNRASCAKTGHCGAVLPCLSPRGDRLAYVSPGGAAGTYTVTVMPVPR